MKFEYRIVSMAKAPDEDFLNQLGNNGWDLCSVIYQEIGLWTLFLKRELVF